MKRLVLHPKVYTDIDQVMRYYEQEVAAPELADAFYVELRSLIEESCKSPESFSLRKGDIRRANLKRFPYHFLFRTVGETVRVLVVRHHGRRPSLGTERR